MNPKPSLAGLSRDQLHRHAVDRFVVSGGTRPDVLLIEYQGQRAVLKDYSSCDTWFRWLFGRLFAWREARVLERLRGVAGVPRLIARVATDALLMEHVEGLPLKRRPESTPVHPDIDKLQRLVENIHVRGVAHGDLRSFSNVLIAEDGRPHIVDFVAAVMRGPQWNRPWNWMFRNLCAADDSALRKIKQRYEPERLTELEYRQLNHESLLQAAARTFGHGLRSLRGLFASEARLRE